MEIQSKLGLVFAIVIALALTGCLSAAPPSAAERAASVEASRTAALELRVEDATRLVASGDATAALEAYAEAINGLPDGSAKAQAAGGAIKIIHERNASRELSAALDEYAEFRSRLSSSAVSGLPVLQGAIHYDLITYARSYAGLVGAMVSTRRTFVSDRYKSKVRIWRLTDTVTLPGPSRLLTAEELTAIAQRCEALGEPATTAAAYRALAALAPAAERYLEVDRALQSKPTDVPDRLFVIAAEGNSIVDSKLAPALAAIEAAE